MQAKYKRLATGLIALSVAIISFIVQPSEVTLLSACLIIIYAIFFQKTTRHVMAISALGLGIVLELLFIHLSNVTPTELNLLIVHLITIALIAGIYLIDTLDSLKLSYEKKPDNIDRKMMTTLVNSMTDGVLAIDGSGVVDIYNGSALDILNINASLEGHNISEFFELVDAKDEPFDILSKTQSGSGYYSSRNLLLKIDETEKINVYINISPVKFGYGEESPGGFIIIIRDITREKSLEEERDEFISVVSHELRTPITIAEGNLSNAIMVAENDKLNQMIVQSLEESHKQVIFLSEMINDLATLSRAEQGKLQNKPEVIDVHELIKGLRSDYRSQARQKNLDFNTVVDKNVTNLTSSRLYVREILQNFITNAIKYTQSGDISLTVEQIENFTVFKVKDSGIGISKADQKLLFNKFFRSEDYRTRENNGTGLGLYVTLKLAKLIGAEITVDSVLNEGSTFTIKVPSMEIKTPKVKSL